MTSANVSEENYIDLHSILLCLWLRKKWIIASVLVTAAAFTALAFIMRPIYQASTVLISADTNKSALGSLGSALGSLGGLASMAGINVGGGAGSDVEEAVAVLQSREFTERFISEKGLLPVLFSKRWDSRLRAWKAGAEQPTLAQAFKFFDRSVRSVNRDKKTGLITLSIRWKDAQLAAEWANELVHRLNAEMRARAIGKANASLGYLEKELDNTSLVGTKEAITRVIQAQIEHRMLATVSDEYALRVVDRALPPDPEDPVRPKKLLMIAIGPIVGGIVGAVGVLVFSWVAASVALIRKETAVRQPST